MGRRSVGCIHMTQDTVQRRAIVNTVMKGGEFLDPMSDHKLLKENATQQS